MATPQKQAQLAAAEAHEQAIAAGFLNLELQLNAQGRGPVAGVDEAGRGACCGPITIAACVLPTGDIAELAEQSGHSELTLLTDSKKLTPARRDRLFDLIQQVASAYSVIHISAADIDERGIQYANTQGMLQAVAELTPAPGYVLTDAVFLPELTVPHHPLVKGDLLSPSISAASVLAKVSRDRLMADLSEEYPEYGLAGHKGYGTAQHMAAVRLHGGTPHHRYTYSNVATAHEAWQKNNH